MMRRDATLYLLVFSLVLGVTVSMLAGPARAGDKGTESAKLVAPEYPGSVLVSGHEWQDFHAFYTRDPLPKVVRFYEKRLGKKIKDGFIGTGLRGYSRMAAKKQEAGVYIHGMAKNRSEAAEKALDELKSMTSGMPGQKKTQAEYRKVYEKYKHLATSYFLVTEDGKGMDEAIYSKYSDKVKGAGKGVETGMEDMGARMQELMAQGNIDDIEKFSQQMLAMQEKGVEELEEGRVGGLDLWDNWVECLKEMDRHAYPTSIAIDKHPSQWQ